MEKKGVGRPRDGNPEETRRQILEAASRAFAESGFVGATTRTVAARAGVNVATLHYHYGSKEGLYRAVLAHVSRGTLPEIPAAQGAARIEALVEALFEHGSGRPDLARLALLDLLAGPGGSPADPRVRWLGEALRPADGGPAGGDGATGTAARTIVALVDAAFVAAAARVAPSPAGDLPAAPDEAARPLLPDAAARKAVVAAALRLTGLG